MFLITTNKSFGLVKMSQFDVTLARIVKFRARIQRRLSQPNLDTIPVEASDDYSVAENTWWSGVCGSGKGKISEEKVSNDTQQTSFSGSLLQLAKLEYLWTGIPGFRLN